MSPCPSGAQLCLFIFLARALSSACPVPALLWKHLGHAGAKPWRGRGNSPLQDATKLQGDSPIPRDRGCSRQAKEGSGPLGTHLWGILAWDTGAQGPPCTPGELGKEAQPVAADSELALHLLGDITPLRPCLLLRWDHTRRGLNSPVCVRAADARQWCWGE